MWKIYLINCLALFSISQTAFSQKVSTYLTDSGLTLKSGDTLVLFEPSNFQDKYRFIFGTKGKTQSVYALREFKDSQGKTSSKDIRKFRKYAIKHFVENNDGSLLAVIGSGMILNFYVDIENALDAGEILFPNSELTESFWKPHNYITGEVSFLEYASRQPEVKIEIAKEFLFLFRNEYYRKIREDEFEFYSAIRKAQKEIQLFEPDTSIVYSASFKDVLGNYDFEKESFPIIWKQSPSRISGFNWLTPEDVNKERVELTDLYMNIQTEGFEYLPVKMVMANAFVKSRKDQYGNVDREINMIIRFKIRGTVEVGMSDIGLYSQKWLLDCEPIRIEVFSSTTLGETEMFNQWLGSVKK
ncbi:MAG: DUF4852 domain-containing protein [Cytophagales bacterium]|nr:DUF4852 domain-containing protein [Cytophagales bacterium]